VVVILNHVIPDRSSAMQNTSDSNADI